MDPTGSFIGGPSSLDIQAILFTVDEDGFPIFTPSDTFGLAPNFSGNVIGRFRALNTYNQYVSVYQPNAATYLSFGDPVYCDPVTGLFYRSQGIGDVSGVSLLPHSDHVYKQAPYQDASKEEYEIGRAHV